MSSFSVRTKAKEMAEKLKTAFPHLDRPSPDRRTSAQAKIKAHVEEDGSISYTGFYMAPYFADFPFRPEWPYVHRHLTVFEVLEDDLKNVRSVEIELLAPGEKVGEDPCRVFIMEHGKIYHLTPHGLERGAPTGKAFREWSEHRRRKQQRQLERLAEQQRKEDAEKEGKQENAEEGKEKGGEGGVGSDNKKADGKDDETEEETEEDTEDETEDETEEEKEVEKEEENEEETEEETKEKTKEVEEKQQNQQHQQVELENKELMCQPKEEELQPLQDQAAVLDC